MPNLPIEFILNRTQVQSQSCYFLVSYKCIRFPSSIASLLLRSLLSKVWEFTALIKFILQLMSVVMGCGDNAYRCTKPGNTVDQDWQATLKCMGQSGTTETCWCYHWAENYADPSGGQIQKFKDCCNGMDNYSWREC